MDEKLSPIEEARDAGKERKSQGKPAKESTQEKVEKEQFANMSNLNPDDFE